MAPRKPRSSQSPAHALPSEAASSASVRDWWLLVHQLPPQPPGLRMRVWRRLQDLGAQAIKGSIYVLPATEEAREDLQWLLGEIRSAGAEASLWCARSVDGLDDAALIERFRAASEAEYAGLEVEVRDLRRALSARRPLDTNEAIKRAAKLRGQFATIGRRDHFEAPRREIVGALLHELDVQLQGQIMGTSSKHPTSTLDRSAFQARTWVTRANIHVDRMASAWLIQRFIDPKARFVFVDDARTAVTDGLRFDMYAGEFSHEGDLCTFEVLLRRFDVRSPGLERIAQIVHDIDLKESRYALEETAGLAASLDAIAEAAQSDEQRLVTAATLFDGLLRRFARV